MLCIWSSMCFIHLIHFYILDLASNPITSFAVLSSAFFLLNFISFYFCKNHPKWKQSCVLNQYRWWYTHNIVYWVSGSLFRIIYVHNGNNFLVYKIASWNVMFWSLFKTKKKIFFLYSYRAIWTLSLGFYTCGVWISFLFLYRK